MKIVSFIAVLVFLAILSAPDVIGQDCKKFHRYSSCMLNPQKFYKTDGQSRSNVIGVGDKLLYNVIFYGERVYKLDFCATDQFIPVHYILTDGVTKELIYDSKTDEYPETLEMNIENTRKILIEISVLALHADQQMLENYFGCVGFLMQWKPLKR